MDSSEVGANIVQTSVNTRGSRGARCLIVIYAKSQCINLNKTNEDQKAENTSAISLARQSGEILHI